MGPPRQRRLHAARLARLIVAVAVGLLLGLAIDVVRSGGSVAWLAHRGVVPPYEARGQHVRVDAAGRTVYLDCRGTGSPTIVFEAGAGTGADGWGFTFPESSGISRACAWDRPGIGRSPARGVHTAAATARDLRAALESSGETPPFIVVGHSLGGLYARIFARAHASEVAGLVLIDPYTPDVAPVDLAPAPIDFRTDWHAQIDRTNRLVADAEQLDWAATARELAAADLGELPLELLVVDQRLRYPPTLGEPTVRGLIAAWESLVLALSADVRLTVAHGSSHLIQQDRPELVVSAIRRLVERVRATHVDDRADQANRHSMGPVQQ
jgi:pimeloyl-ACP methyl ester carboxylesterase